MDYLEVKIKTDASNFEILQALLQQYQFESFVDYEGYFDAYIDGNLYQNENVKAEIDSLKSNFDFEYSVKKIENKNWNEEWEKNFSPILVENKCLVRASFHDSIDGIEDEIIITPKMSFGTGHHATTYMMINEMYKIDLNNKSVLDMGCGTAVLAILAKKKGSAYTLGIDIDDWAVENSIENCTQNDQSEIEIIKGDAQKLTEYQKFDVILANINRNILLDDMKVYAQSLLDGGEILFSGFYTEDNSLIQKEAEKHNFKLIDQNERENWSLLHYKKGN